jgi:hypothetical protein
VVTRKKPIAVKKVPRKVAPKSRASAKAPVLVEIEPVVRVPEPEVTVVLPTPDKQKLIRDSFTMPKLEYELLAALKARLLGLSTSTKKSELLRAGVVALALMSDVELLAAVARIPSLKTGRPKKNKDSKKKS